MYIVRRLWRRILAIVGALLLVLGIASVIWRPTVSRLASVSSVALIDVSEPTANLIRSLSLRATIHRAM
jgi:hypothetical protein